MPYNNMATSTAILSYALIGEIKLYSSNTIPDGWLVCDGSTVSRTTYANLFNVIGTTYGTGDGSTTFAIPDLRGRTAIGTGESSATGHTAHTLGQMAGEETHTLNIDEMPRHRHSLEITAGAKPGGEYSADWTRTGIGYTSYEGADQSHNNMQPFTCVNYIIYTGRKTN